MISRQLSAHIQEMASKFPVISITGPRQSGKTTLCKFVFENYQYVSLENPDLREFALTDPRGFLKQYNKHVILDEVQNVPELFSFIQEIVDNSKINGQFILSGSQNFLLAQQISQSLAGRTFIFNLLPLSLEELKSTEFFFDTYQKHIFYGGYPRIFDSDIHPKHFYPSYIQTYIERDLRNISNVHDLNLFRQFIKICAGRVGQLINTNAIGNELGINHKTVKNWLSILESSFIIFMLKPWHKNFNKRIIKSPKLYFYDTGLACNLLGINDVNEVDLHFAKGALFENFIITEILKSGLNNLENQELYFWRDNTGHEIDLILESSLTAKFIEMKSAQTVSASFFKGLDYLERISSKEHEKYIVFGGTSSQNRTEHTILSWKELNKIT